LGFGFTPIRIHPTTTIPTISDMTAPKIKPSPIPVSFDQFRKNPVAAVAFCMLLAVSYLYMDLRSGYKEQIEKSNQKIDALDLKIDRLSYALKKSDSALAAAITEIRIMNTMKKL
jgi:hypothetical protein